MLNVSVKGNHYEQETSCNNSTKKKSVSFNNFRMIPNEIRRIYLYLRNMNYAEVFRSSFVVVDFYFHKISRHRSNKF